MKILGGAGVDSVMIPASQLPPCYSPGPQGATSYCSCQQAGVSSTRQHAPKKGKAKLNAQAMKEQSNCNLGVADQGDMQSPGALVGPGDAAIGAGRTSCNGDSRGA